MCYLPDDPFVGRLFDDTGEYSEREVELFAKIVQPGDVVIEVGANVGMFSLPLAKMVGPKGSLICFEPQRVICQLLAATLTLNDIHHAWTYPYAAGDSDQWITMPALEYGAGLSYGGVEMGPDAGWRTQTDETISTERVRQVKLDGVLDDVAQCKLLKIDVEGMELAVLKGATLLIRRTLPIIYVECDRLMKARALIDWIKAEAYDPFWVQTDLGLPNCVSTMLLCFPAAWNTQTNLEPAV
jgi:FkbM family methyltransferase